MAKKPKKSPIHPIAFWGVWAICAVAVAALGFLYVVQPFAISIPTIAIFFLIPIYMIADRYNLEAVLRFFDKFGAKILDIIAKMIKN